MTARLIVFLALTAIFFPALLAGFVWQNILINFRMGRFLCEQIENWFNREVSSGRDDC